MAIPSPEEQKEAAEKARAESKEPEKKEPQAKPDNELKGSPQKLQTSVPPKP